MFEFHWVTQMFGHGGAKLSVLRVFRCESETWRNETISVCAEQAPRHRQAERHILKEAVTGRQRRRQRQRQTSQTETEKFDSDAIRDASGPC